MAYPTLIEACLGRTPCNTKKQTKNTSTHTFQCTQRMQNKKHTLAEISTLSMDVVSEYNSYKTLIGMYEMRGQMHHN